MPQYTIKLKDEDKVVHHICVLAKDKDEANILAVKKAKQLLGVIGIAPFKIIE